MRYADPTIEESTLGLAEDGATRVIHASLSPYESAVSTLAYRDAVCGAAGCVAGLEVVETGPYHTHPAFVGALASAAREALESVWDSMPAFVVFSAHSLPVADIEEDDSYVVQLRETATAVARELGLGEPGTVRFAGEDVFGTLEGETPWVLAYQSKGRREVEWLGPDLADVLAAVAHEQAGSVVVSPIGFVTDHLETLYDIDLEAAGRARDLGLEFARAAVPNDDPAMVSALADVILEADAPQADGR
jgi:ferrochelatase